MRMTLKYYKPRYPDAAWVQIIRLLHMQDEEWLEHQKYITLLAMLGNNPDAQKANIDAYMKTVKEVYLGEKNNTPKVTPEMIARDVQHILSKGDK